MRAKLKTLTHEQRQALIKAAVPNVQYIGGATYAGRRPVDDPWMPDDGRRIYVPAPEDEEFYARRKD